MVLPESLERLAYSNVDLMFGNSIIFIDEQDGVVHVYGKDVKPSSHWWGAIAPLFRIPLDDKRKMWERYRFTTARHSPEDKNIYDVTMVDSISQEEFNYSIHMITRTAPENLSSMARVESAEFDERTKYYQSRFGKMRSVA